jgi:hypothetical protein
LCSLYSAQTIITVNIPYFTHTLQATIILAFLIQNRRMRLAAAYKLLRAKRPQAKPKAHFLRQLAALERHVLDHDTSSAASALALTGVSSGDVDSGGGGGDGVSSGGGSGGGGGVGNSDVIGAKRSRHSGSEREDGSNGGSCEAATTATAAKRQKVIQGPTMPPTQTGSDKAKVVIKGPMMPPTAVVLKAGPTMPPAFMSSSDSSGSTDVMQVKGVMRGPAMPPASTRSVGAALPPHMRK